ncbi:hypothetical protein [Pseudomonas koreensis]|uniref:hypothetical protein n=1 Tax=Pseudomonas koreensis TaxID=198620 RepID=UPI002FCA7733
MAFNVVQQGGTHQRTGCAATTYPMVRRKNIPTVLDAVMQILLDKLGKYLVTKVLEYMTQQLLLEDMAAVTANIRAIY